VVTWQLNKTGMIQWVVPNIKILRQIKAIIDVEGGSPGGNSSLFYSIVNVKRIGTYKTNNTSCMCQL
jgi:hypothetical protein